MITLEQAKAMHVDKRKYKYYILEETNGYTTIFLLCRSCYKKYNSAVDLLSKYMKRLVFIYELLEDQGEDQDQAVNICDHVAAIENVVSLEYKRIERSV
jgi:hypothetical protein